MFIRKEAFIFFIAAFVLPFLCFSAFSQNNSDVQEKLDKGYPRIVITKVKVLGRYTAIRSDSDVRKEILFPETVKLPWKDDFLKIEFEIVGGEQPEQCQFKYKITGHDEEWIDIGNKNFVILENLKFGKYEFLVNGSNSEGIWSEEPASLKINLVPPFWRTSVFKGIVFIFVIALSFFVYLFLRRMYRLMQAGKINIEQISTEYNLTKRELEILGLLLEGRSINKMAQELFISESTVQKHIYSVYKKLKIHNRIQLMNFAQRYRLK